MNEKKNNEVKTNEYGKMKRGLIAGSYKWK
jgi:hypothetical protein